MALRNGAASHCAAQWAALAAALLLACTPALANPAGGMQRLDQEGASAELPRDRAGASADPNGPGRVAAGRAALDIGESTAAALPADDSGSDAGRQLKFNAGWSSRLPIIGPAAPGAISVDLGSRTTLALRPRQGRWGLLLTRRW